MYKLKVIVEVANHRLTRTYLENWRDLESKSQYLTLIYGTCNDSTTLLIYHMYFPKRLTKKRVSFTGV